MCGINGIIKKNALVIDNEISRMNRAVLHRGPDGEGIFTKDNIGIGHRRLSIIDLGLGAQPMSDIEGQIYITFNGEIYNYRELRSELVNCGYCFRTNSDTETIIYAYKEWGINCLNKLIGMFAFGIIDYRSKKIFTARDYLGIKPLVYYSDDDLFAFSSEIEGLKQIDGIDLSIDYSGMYEYLRLSYIPAPKTIYSKVHKLKPGHYIIADFDATISEQIPYYSFAFSPQAVSEKEILERLDYEIEESVKRHLLSDVPYGAFLSGGIDSTLVVEYMTRICDVPVKTFSIGCSQKEYDESNYAEYVSQKLGTEHYGVIIDEEALRELPNIIRCHGEPSADSSDICTYFVSKLARETGVKVVLSGDAGDELFAGYKTYLEWASFVRYNNLPSTAIKEVLLPLFHKLNPQKYPANTLKKTLDLERWILRNNYMTNEYVSNLFRAEYIEAIPNYLESFEAVYEETKMCSAINKVQYMDLKTYLPYDILQKVDAASMANSIEVRTPFIDKNIIELAMSIPEKMNIKYSKKYGYSGKELLKKLLSDYPSDFLYRKKQGFSIPLIHWLNDSRCKAYELKNELLSEQAYINEFFDRDSINRLVTSDNAGKIWQLIVLENWLQQEKGR